MSKGQLSAEQNAHLRRLVRDELLTRVPKQLHLARLLGMPQGNLSRFLDGKLGATAPIVLRIASLLNRPVEEVLGIAPAPELVDPQEWRYPSRILSARAAYREGVPLNQIRATLSASLRYDGDPGALWWLKMMREGHIAKPGTKRDTDWALKQVKVTWDKATKKSSAKGKRR